MVRSSTSPTPYHTLHLQSLPILSSPSFPFLDSDLPLPSTDPQPGTTYKLPNYSNYLAPQCPGAPCGTCYTITNKANGNKVTVQVVDACPSDTAWNYCKALASNPMDDVPANQRCADPNTNQVDIDVSAYPALTDGQSYSAVSLCVMSYMGSTPNLDIRITSNPGCIPSRSPQMLFE
ncbi:MAG: hypothetical protein LQ338_000369 [Usnochroma carphineum]|nr:MAG: hypothetical protein LQ338_000369 [Usnochroma carphineum]